MRRTLVTFQNRERLLLTLSFQIQKPSAAPKESDKQVNPYRPFWNSTKAVSSAPTRVNWLVPHQTPSYNFSREIPLPSQFIIFTEQKQNK